MFSYLLKDDLPKGLADKVICNQQLRLLIAAQNCSCQSNDRGSLTPVELLILLVAS